MKIERTQLLDALDKARVGVSDKEIIEQSTNFVFRDGHILTFNDEIAVSTPFDIGIEGAVPANELYKLLKRFKAKEIDFSTKVNELHIKTKKASSGILFNKNVELPIDEVFEEEFEWKEISEDILSAIEFCKFSVSKNTNKPVLNCVHLFEDRVESCDNYRFTIYNLEEETFEQSILLPVSSAKELSKFGPLVAYGAAGAWCHFKTEEGTIISCRTIDGTFPNLDEIIEKDDLTKFTFPTNIDGMIDRAEVFVDHSNFDTEVINVSLYKDQIKIKSTGASGWFEEKAKLDKKAERVNFRVNPAFLKQIIKEHNTAQVGERMLVFEGDNFLHAVSLIVEE